ncbi:MAG: hypothetical protein E4G93_05170, partial [Dehalococcoidia bacterium]
MTDKLETALDRCIKRMQAGESIEACLKDHPELASDHVPLLMLSAEISSVEETGLRTGFCRTCRMRVLLRARALSQDATGPVQRLLRKLSRQLQSVLSRFPSTTIPSRRVLIPLGAAATVALLSASLLPPPGGAALMAASCTVNSMTGSVQVLNSHVDGWTMAEAGMTLEEGAHVRTAEDAEAVVTLFDGSTVEVLPNSELEFQYMQSTGDDQKTIQLAQIAGKTWHRVVALVDSRSSYEVRTPSAYCSVRGTYFQVEMQEDNTTRVRVNEGTVAVEAEGEEVAVCEGFQVDVHPGVVPSQPTRSKDDGDEDAGSETDGDGSTAEDAETSEP